MTGPPKTVAAWIPCHSCDEHWCTLHRMHVANCPCPPIEEWDVDPYSAMPARDPVPPPMG